MSTDKPHDVERVLDATLDQLDGLAAEDAATDALIRHAAAVHVRRAGDQRAHFEGIRETSRDSIRGMALEAESYEAAEAIRARMLERHARVFEAAAGALGLEPGEARSGRPGIQRDGRD